MNRMENKTVLLVEGIGQPARAIADLLAQEGAAVERCVYSGREALERAFSDVLDRRGNIDVLVCCTAFSDDGTGLVRTSDELWQKCVEMEQNAVFYACREFVRRTSGTGRVIINVVSEAGMSSASGAATAAASAAALTLTKNIARFYTARGIRCCAVCVPERRTEKTDTERAWYAGGGPAPAAPEPTDAETAETVLLLAGSGAACISGQCVRVNGGAR